MVAKAREYKMAFPTARDRGTISGEAWKIMWWPTYAIIDRDGIVRALGIRSAKVESAVKELLKEQPGPRDI